MLWGAALYNNGAFPLKDATSVRATRRTAARSGSRPSRSRLSRRRACRACSLRSCPCRGSSHASRATCCASRAGDDRLSFRGYGTLTRTDPVFQGLQRTGCSTRRSRSSAPTIIRGLSLQRLQRLPRGLRQRPEPVPLRTVRARGKPRTSATVDPTFARRAGHPILSRVHAGDPVEPVRRLSHASRHRLREQLFRLYLVDNGTHGEFMVPAAQRRATPNKSRVPHKNPRRPPVRGLWSDLDPDGGEPDRLRLRPWRRLPAPDVGAPDVCARKSRGHRSAASADLRSPHPDRVDQSRGRRTPRGSC